MSILEAIGNIFGAVTSSNSADKANDMARNQFAYQRELNKNQIQWRVADAVKAGIHPLYALGPTGASFSPVSGGTSDAGEYISRAGQDISRSVMSMMSGRERREAAQAAVVRERMQDDMVLQRHNADMERSGLENALLRSQIARANSGQLGPGAPVQAQAGAVNRVPARVEVGSRGAPAEAPGAITEYQFQRQSGGRYGVLPSDQSRERTEDSPMEWQWFLRNNIIPPRETTARLTQQHPPRPGYEWRWNMITGSYSQQPIRSIGRHPRVSRRGRDY